MYGQSPYPSFPEVLHLVFHKGDQRADDKADALFGQGRNLKTDTLAATCRHKGKGVLFLSDAPDQLFLGWPERLISPVLVQYLPVFLHLSCQVNGHAFFCGDFQFFARRVNVCGAGDSLFSKEHLSLLSIENFRGSKIFYN